MLTIGPVTYVSISIGLFFYLKMLFTKAKLAADKVYMILLFTPIFVWFVFDYFDNLKMLEIDSNKKSSMIFMNILLNFAFYFILVYFKPIYNISNVKSKNNDEKILEKCFLFTFISLVMFLVFIAKPKDLSFCQLKCRSISALVGDIHYVYGMHYIVSIFLGMYFLPCFGIGLFIERIEGNFISKSFKFADQSLVQF